MLDVSVAIDDEARSAVLERRSDGEYDEDGNYAPGASRTLTIRALITPNFGTSALFPASGDKLKDELEGTRTEACWLCWSRTEIKLDDLITQDGVTYRVTSVWRRPEGGYYRAELGRTNP